MESMEISPGKKEKEGLDMKKWEGREHQEERTVCVRVLRRDRAWFPRKCGKKRIQDQIFKRPQHLETGQRKELMKEAKKGWSGRWMKIRRIWYHR